MADTQQGVRHQSARNIAGTTGTYDEDLRARFNAVATVPAGSTFNEAFILWLQATTGSSADNINDLAAEYAAQQNDVYNWSSSPEGSLPVSFRWYPQDAATLPGTATFTRASIAQVLTTTDGTTNWYQEAKSGELRLDGLRRVENDLSDDKIDGFSVSGGATISGDDFTFTASSSDFIFEQVAGLRRGESKGFLLELSASVTGTIKFQLIAVSGAGGTVNQDIELTTTPTLYWVTFQEDGTGDGSLQYRIRNDAVTPIAVTVTVSQSMVCSIQSTSSPPEEFTQKTVTYNAEVAGVRYLATTNDDTADGNGVVTKAAGTTITGGGYLPQPAAANLMPFSTDFDDTTWAVNETNLTGTDQGVGALGLNEFEFDAGTNNASHRTLSVQGTTIPTSTAITVYEIVKKGTGQYFALRGPRGSALFPWGVFDLVNGTLGGTNDLTTSRITDLDNDYYKCEIQYTTPSTIANIGIVMAIQDTSTASTTSEPVSFNASNETFFACHVQCGATVFSTSPIVTSGATVAREPDVLDTDIVIASDFGALIDVTLPDVIGTGNTISLLGPDATAEDILRADASFNIIMDDGGTPVTIGTSSAGSRIKVSYGRDGTGRSASLDGATAVTGDAPGAGHEGDTFQIGAANSVNQPHSPMHNIIIYGRKPSDGQLQTLSA